MAFTEADTVAIAYNPRRPGPTPNARPSKGPGIRRFGVRRAAGHLVPGRAPCVVGPRPSTT